jgi:hypothetical protein
MSERTGKGNTELLLFILIFLLLFYDSSYLERFNIHIKTKGDSSLLFFILIFLYLFY